MDGGMFGRALLCCAWLLCALQVCVAMVTVKVSPMLEVMNGESVSLPCSFTVSSPTQGSVVGWYIEEQETRKRVAFRAANGEAGSNEGTPLSGRVAMAANYSLTIKSVAPSDERVFYCQVSAGSTGTGEGSSSLKVFHAPEKPELTRPTTQSISVGSPTSSEIGSCVTKNGHPQPKLTWLKDKQLLPEVKDTKEKTYMVPSVVREASGLFTLRSSLYMQPQKDDKNSEFTCMVEYSMPGQSLLTKTSEPISISLTYPSESVSFTLLNSPVQEGDTVTMKCETDGSPQPGFTFTKNGEELNGQDGLLMLPSVRRTDSGLFRCDALDFDNLDADLTKEINLTVHYIDPMKVNPRGTLVAQLGEAVEMQCKTRASRPHTVLWQKASKVLSQTGSLSLTQVSYEDAGTYTCVGSVPSVPRLMAQASINLTVAGKPMIDDPVMGEVDQQDDMVTLTCSAHGYPAPQFSWKPSGKEAVSVEGNKVVGRLTLKATLEVLQEGVTCQATNQHGMDSKLFSVSIKEGRPGNEADRADRQQGGASGVVVAVVVCVLLLLLLVALLYALNRKDKLPCRRRSHKEVAGQDVNNDIVVEMKTDKSNEEAGLLHKRPADQQ